MTGKVILPINEINSNGKSIFLIGPIVGAPNWHNTAIDLIQGLAPEINIVCPNYHENINTKYWKDSPFRVKNFLIFPDNWPEIEWQERYIKRSLENGCVMAWLPCQIDFSDDYAYSRTTRFEIAEQLHFDGNLVIGYEKKFQGIDYIKYKFRKHRPRTLFCNTLEETCKESIRLALKQN